MPQITHMPLDAAIQARRIIDQVLIAETETLQERKNLCVTLLDEREYEQKEQMWLNEERF